MKNSTSDKNAFLNIFSFLKRKKYLARIVYISIFIIIIFVILNLILSKFETRGKIISYSIKGEEITIEGTLNNIPDNSYVWIAVQVNNELWPKEKNIPPTYSKWKRIVYGSPKVEFALVLLTVSSEGNNYIKSWINKCKADDNWPGIELNMIPGMDTLDIMTSSETVSKATLNDRIRFWIQIVCIPILVVIINGIFNIIIAIITNNRKPTDD